MCFYRNPIRPPAQTLAGDDGQVDPSTARTHCVGFPQKFFR